MSMFKENYYSSKGLNSKFDTKRHRQFGAPLIDRIDRLAYVLLCVICERKLRSPFCRSIFRATGNYRTSTTSFPGPPTRWTHPRSTRETSLAELSSSSGEM